MSKLEVLQAVADLLARDAVLTRFAAHDPITAELVKLSFFAGMTIPEKFRQRVRGSKSITRIVMGTVFMAEQHQPVKRRVVLDVIKPGTNTGKQLSQFLINGDFPCVFLSTKSSSTRP